MIRIDAIWLATEPMDMRAGIHGTDNAVRKAAKNVVGKLPRSKRDVIYDIINSPHPVKLVRHIALNLD